jgi:hypothetical protein
MDVIETPVRPRRGRGAALVAAGLVGGVVLAGFATASAQSPSPSTGGDDGPSSTAPAPGRGPGKGRHGGMGMGIHGEFVTQNPAGDGYQTVATQKGEVTAVSATSITVRSEDGFSRTYTVDDNTLVNAGNDGIGDVAEGDDVRVVALVVDGKASAVKVDDGTNIERLRGRWMPGPPPAESSTDSSAT